MQATPAYRADIDGLRGIAVLGVIGFHSAPNWVRGGFLGVDVFFLISGYLITRLILGKLADGSFTFTDFYIRRAKRIFPALCIVLAASLAAGWLSLLPLELANLGGHAVAGATFLSNVKLLGEAGYFDSGVELKPLLHLWSLAVEEQFYLLWPMLLVLARTRRAFFLTTILLVCASLLANLLLTPGHPVSTFYLPHTRLWELLCGALLASRGMVQIAASPNASSAPQPVSYHGVAAAGLAVVLASFFLVQGGTPSTGWRTVPPVLGAAAIVFAGERSGTSLPFLSSRAIVFVGLISYPLYLWHWPILSFLRITDVTDLTPLAIGAGVGVSFALAWLTYRAIEIPIRFGPNTAPDRRIAIYLGASLLAIALFGFATHRTKGFPARLKQQDLLGSTHEQLLDQASACKAAYPFVADGTCERSPGTVSSPVVLFFGDSHAKSLTLGAAQRMAAANAHFSYLHLGKFGCLPFVGVERFSPAGSNGCSEIADGVIRAIANDRRITTVVLAARHAIYVSALQFSADQRGPVIDTRIESMISRRVESAPPVEVYREGLKRTLDLLEARGLRVIFVHQVPELGFNPSSCLRHELLGVGRPRPLCGVSRNAVEARQAQYRKIVADILVNYPGVRVIDPLEALCDKATCYAIRDGVVLYEDDNHLTADGAAYLLKNSPIAFTKR